MSRIRPAATRLMIVASTAVALSTLTLNVMVSAAPVATAQYTVKAGDFLAGIAAKVGVTLPDLLNANNLTPNSLIVPGQTLVVPAGAKPAAIVAQGPAAPTAGSLKYTVKNGDYLMGIAGAYKVTLADLLAVNKMTVQSLITPGKVLAMPANAVVPQVAAPDNAAPGAPAAAVATPAASSLTYTVASGDFLAGIAAKYKVKLPDLLAVNNLKPTSLILPGLTLSMPVGAVAPAIPPAPLQTAAGPAAVVVAYAYAQLGKPYRFFTDGPDTFDCSGLVKAAYAQIGITLIHQSAAQATSGTLVDIWGTDTIQAGDLVFMATHGDPTAITHVGIAVDSTHWIHSPRPGDVVRLAPLPPKGLITTVRRLIP